MQDTLSPRSVCVGLTGPFQFAIYNLNYLLSVKRFRFLGGLRLFYHLIHHTNK